MPLQRGACDEIRRRPEVIEVDDEIDVARGGAVWNRDHTPLRRVGRVPIIAGDAKQRAPHRPASSTSTGMFSFCYLRYREELAGASDLDVHIAADDKGVRLLVPIGAQAGHHETRSLDADGGLGRGAAVHPVQHGVG